MAPLKPPSGSPRSSGRESGRHTGAASQMLMFAVWRGRVDARSVRFAYEYAASPKHDIGNREAYFWTTVRDKTGIRGDELEGLAYGEDFPNPRRPRRRGGAYGQEFCSCPEDTPKPRRPRRRA